MPDCRHQFEPLTSGNPEPSRRFAMYGLWEGEEGVKYGARRLRTYAVGF